MMKQEIIATRIINASIDSVWKCWTEPELVMRWWGPDQFSSPRAMIDFRENSFSVVCMKAPAELGGQELYNVWAYSKIIPGAKIEYVQNLSDEHGNIADPASVSMPADFPKDTRTTVIFKARGKNRTGITFREVADFGQMFEAAKTGLEQCLDKMVALFQQPWEKNGPAQAGPVNIG